MVSHPIKNLLTDLIDYAGLFPPAKLDMLPAVTEFGRQRGSAEAWILGRFVIPVGRLQEAESAMGKCRGALDGLWTFSALVGDDAESSGRAAVDAFNARNEGRCEILSVETKPSSPADVERLAASFKGLEIFHELAYTEHTAPILEAIASCGNAAKIRTGGITDDAIPAIPEVARFLSAVAEAGVPFKATAGLHHPIRGAYRLTYEDDSPDGTMHGFLNLFLAAAFAYHGKISSTEIRELLGLRQSGALDFSAAGVSWKEHRLSSDEIASARQDFARSYGSCSFAEPVEDLRRLHLL